MKELNVYLKQKNQWLAIFGDKPLSLKSAKDRQIIAGNLDSDLSPENLSCDGELTGNQVRSRYTALTMAANQLKKLDPSVTFYG
jgi:hypothetical protein